MIQFTAGQRVIIVGQYSGAKTPGIVTSVSATGRRVCVAVQGYVTDDHTFNWSARRGAHFSDYAGYLHAAMFDENEF